MTTSTQPAPPSDDVAPRLIPRRARIDGPHPTSDGLAADGGPLLEVIDEPAADLVSAVIGESEAARHEQLELQAAQIGDHLRERLRDVDRREAQLNARVAQVEADLRSSRVWLREQEHAFAEREAELRRQLEDARARGEGQSGDPAGATDWETARGELLERERQLQLKENDLRERRLEVERQAAALRHAQQLAEQEQSRQAAEVARQRERLTRDFREQSSARDATLRDAEQIVAEQSRKLAQDRAELLADRRQWEERRNQQALALEQRTHTLQIQCDDKGRRLDARSEWMERQKHGLDQVRTEIATLHRQSLEMRLIAEQLWAQISGRLTPVEITQSIAHLRLKLAEHYRLEEQSLEAKQGELLELAQRVAEQHRELVQLRSGLKSWGEARQAEIEQQAAQLVQRELALDGQQEALRQARHEWQSQRLAYEQQIRTLAEQVRELPAAA